MPAKTSHRPTADMAPMPSMARMAPLAWLPLLALLLAAPAAARELPPPDQRTATADEPAPLEYIEIVTAGADPREDLPLILVVHGLGDRPEDFVRVFDDFPVPARVVAARGPLPRGRGRSWFPIRFPIRADDPAMIEGIRESSAKLAALARWLTRRRPIVGRPIITGFSQGGILSFAVALHHPETVSAAVPVAGALPPALWGQAPMPPGTGRLPPIRALHGEADRVVPYLAANALVLGLKAGGRDATMQPFAGVAHRIPPEMRRAVFATIQSVMPR